MNETTNTNEVIEVREVVRLQRSRIVAIALVAVGILVLIIGWIGTANALYSSQQLPYVISGGLGGIALIGLGATAWLSSDLADEWTKLDLIEDALRRLESERSTSAVVAEATTVDAAASNGVTPAQTGVDSNGADPAGKRNRRPPLRAEAAH